MYRTNEWQIVKNRNGWMDNYKADKDFYNFLEGQERQIGHLMSELGFLKIVGITFIFPYMSVAIIKHSFTFLSNQV